MGQSHRSYRVLIVDDNLDILETTSLLLELAGFQTVAVEDPLKAVALAEGLRPDALILDIQMPHMDGYELCERIRATDWGASLLIIAMSGRSDAQHRRHASACGFNMQFTKPVDPSMLTRAIEGALHS